MGKALPLMEDSRLWRPAKNHINLALRLIMNIIGVAAYGSRHKKWSHIAPCHHHGGNLTALIFVYI